MIEIGKIFVNDENKIEIQIHNDIIRKELLLTNSENILGE